MIKDAEEKGLITPGKVSESNKLQHQLLIHLAVIK